MKAGPKLAQYEDAESSRVKFSDLHGVDEAKEVSHIDPVIYALCSQP